MSDGEQKLLDTQGDYLYAVRDGQVNEGASWNSCRLILTTERLVLSTGSNRQTVPIDKVALEPDPPDIEATQYMTNVTALSVGNNVILVTVSEGGVGFEICRAILHDGIILVKHPAVKGGVIQETAWEKAKFRYVDDTIKMALSDGRLSIDMDNVGNIDTTEKTVRDQNRLVISVEHTEDDLSVETYLTGADHHTTALDALFTTAVEKNQASVDQLDEAESQVLMGLYSGVSPFEIPEFVGLPPEEVEEVYQHLLEIDAVDEVRMRTEVELNARGRNMAADAMSEQ